MDEADWQKWFEGIWAQREERVYPAFFGDLGPGIYTIPMSTFASLGRADPDPRYLTHGVFESPPTQERAEWVYVSSGMSNPWGDSPETIQAGAYSGLGFEFTMHTRERAKWAVQMLHWIMAVQLLVAAGELSGSLLERNDRIPLGGPLGKRDGVLTHLLVGAPPRVEEGGYPGEFELPSGKVEMMVLVGITEKESEFAKTQGAEGLVKLLMHHGVWAVTDVGRVGVV